MTVPATLETGLMLPAIASPMFLASGPRLVIECCKSGMIGTFPALNQRTSEGLDLWLSEIEASLEEYQRETGNEAASYGVNLIVHKSNARLHEDLAICVKHKVPLIITSLGANDAIVDAIHAYGGLVFHDVTTIKHAKKAASVGVDGLIAVAAGAGGHAGTLSPFAMVNEIRQFFDKTLILAGSISTGRDIAAAKLMGADLVYMGTRLLATEESMVQQGYKEMLTKVSAKDIVYTPAISGIHANFIKQSIEAAGLDSDVKDVPANIDFGSELKEALETNSSKGKAWKDIWSAGQGVGSIQSVPCASVLIEALTNEYQQARKSI